MIPQTEAEWKTTLTEYRRAGMSRSAIVEALGCPPYTVVKRWNLLPPELRTQRSPVKDIVFDFLDKYDGDPYSLTAPEIAERIGVAKGSVLHYRRAWKRGTEYLHAERCETCGIAFDERNPLIADGCFLCWLNKHGIPPLEVSENGDWAEMIILARRNGNATRTDSG